MEIFDGLQTVVLDALLFALGGALGFFGRRYFDKRDRRKQRKSMAIVELHKLKLLLIESKSVFINQNRQVRKFESEVIEKYGEKIETNKGFDETLYQAYDFLTESEKEYFHVIRGTTEHSMLRLNEKLRNWADVNNAAQLLNVTSENVKEFDSLLMQLRLHLNGWFAKYEAIFSYDEKRSLVYLNDENNHGISFPSRLQNSLELILDEIGGQNIDFITDVQIRKSQRPSQRETGS